MNKLVVAVILSFGVAAQCEASKTPIVKIARFENKVTYPLLQKMSPVVIAAIIPLKYQINTFVIPVVTPLAKVEPVAGIPVIPAVKPVAGMVGIPIVQAVKPVAGVSSNVLDTAASVTISGNSPLFSVRIKAEDANRKLNDAEHQARADEYLRELNLAVERSKLLKKRKK